MRMRERLIYVALCAFLLSSCASSATLKRIEELEARAQSLAMREHAATMEVQRLERKAAQSAVDLGEAKRALESAETATVEQREALQARVAQREREAAAANQLAASAKTAADTLAKNLDTVRGELSEAEAQAEKERAESKSGWGEILENFAPALALVPVGGSVAAQAAANIGRRMQKKQADDEALKAAIIDLIKQQKEESTDDGAA